MRHAGDFHNRGCQDQAQAHGQDPRAVLPHRRRRRAHQARRPGDRGDRQVPPEGGALAHRGRLRAGAVLARRRRPADRAGRRASSRSPATGRSSRACRAPRARCGSPRRKADKKAVFEAAAKESAGEPKAERDARRARRRRQEGRRRGRGARRRGTPRPRQPRRGRRGTRRRGDRPPRQPPPRRRAEAPRRAEAAPRRGSRPPRPPTDRGTDGARPRPCSRRPSSTWSGASSTTRTTSRSATARCAAGRVLEVRVHPDDLGKVIGRGGRTATALRTVIGALGAGSRRPRRLRRRRRALARRRTADAGRRRPDRPAARHPRRGRRSRSAPTTPSGRLAPGAVLRTDPAARRAR